MSDSNWFQKKWGFGNTPIDELHQKVAELENRVKLLEEENINTTNSLYEIANSLEARIDILASGYYTLDKFTLDK